MKLKITLTLEIEDEVFQAGLDEGEFTIAELKDNPKEIITETDTLSAELSELLADCDLSEVVQAIELVSPGRLEDFLTDSN